MGQFTLNMALYAPYTSIWDADWTDPYRATAIEDSYAPASSVFGVTFEDMSWPIVCDSEDTSNPPRRHGLAYGEDISLLTEPDQHGSRRDLSLVTFSTSLSIFDFNHMNNL